MYALSSKSGSEPFRFALFLGDLRWNDPIVNSVLSRGAKHGGVGAVSTPPEFWMGGVEHLSTPPDFEKKFFRGGWLPLN